MSAPEVSIVIPVFNEAEAIRRTLTEIQSALAAGVAGYEILVIDDGSTDATAQVLAELAVAEPRIVPVQLSRNYGKEAALSAGLELARGACIVFMDADLQHPPAMLPGMLEQWRAGFDVVNATKRDRGREPLAYRLFARGFNHAMSEAVGKDFSGASDYKLIDRQVADALRQCPERNRFFRGLVAWVGFRETTLAFDVPARTAGTTKWTNTALLRYSLNNLVAFSSFPMRLVAYLGFFNVVLGTILLIQTLIRYALGGAATGFTTVIAVQILLGGAILLSLGVIAIYVAKIYEEQKARPLFIIRRPRGPGKP